MTQFTYGLELEMSSLSISGASSAIMRTGVQGWQVKPDGTNHVSAEAVSPILTADRLNESRTVARALVASGGTVNKQTGYHVHIGADLIGLEGIANMVWNWNHAHATIGALVAPSRLNNSFCRPVDATRIADWCDNVRGGDINNNGNGRYYSLNLNSYDRHKTVEVRLHHGTLNGAKIQAWAEFVGAMAQYGKDGNRFELETWTDSANRLNNINTMLDILAVDSSLDNKTATYLKARALELASR
jgi:hypothetical protein